MKYLFCLVSFKYEIKFEVYVKLLNLIEYFTRKNKEDI